MSQHAEMELVLDWRERAACRGSGAEFVDVDAEHGEALVHRYRARCPTVEPCRALAAELLPIDGGSVWAGAYYPKRTRVEVAP